MGHVDTQNPEQVVAFVGGEAGQGVEKAPDGLGFLGQAPGLDALAEGAAKDRQDADVGAEAVLEEDDLELDGVLRAVAIVLHHGRFGGFFGEPLHQAGLGLRDPEGGAERFPRESEAAGPAVVGRSQDHERARGRFFRDGAIGRRVHLPAAFGADVGRGDADGAGDRGDVPSAGEIAFEEPAQFLGVFRVGGAGMGGLPDGGRGELAVAPVAEFEEGLVLEEAGVGERLDEAFLNAADVQRAGEAHQIGAQVEVGGLAVETLQALHQRGRDDQGGVGIQVGIANQQTGLVLEGRRHEVQVQAELGEPLSHRFHDSRGAASDPDGRGRTGRRYPVDLSL